MEREEIKTEEFISNNKERVEKRLSSLLVSDIKADSSEEKGIIIGVASTESLNSHGFKVDKNAFSESILKRGFKGASGIKLAFSHDTNKVVGLIEDISLTNEDLTIKVRLNMDLQVSQEIYSNLKMGIGMGFSVGFAVLEDYVDKKGILYVTKGDLFEVSLTYFPSNEDCGVKQVLHKDKENVVLQDIKEIIKLDKKNALLEERCEFLEKKIKELEEKFNMSQNSEPEKCESKPSYEEKAYLSIFKDYLKISKE